MNLESNLAAEERERFVEEDALGGIIGEYLDTPVPSDWEKRQPQSKQEWLLAYSQGFVTPDEFCAPVRRVCSAQVWVEALGRRMGDQKRVDLLNISEALKSLPGWRRLPGQHHMLGYGKQVVYVREEDIT